MEQRPLRLGDIVDDYCPRERRITNHVIVAIVGDAIRQTRCQTCDSDHVYKEARVPKRKKKEDTAALYDQVLADASGGQLVHPRVAGEEPAGDPPGEPPAARATAAEPPPEPPGEGEGGDQARSEDENGGHLELWSAHRPLIRATLPRTEGEPPPTRPIPEFTMHQRQPQRGGGHGFRHGHGWQGNGQPPRHGGGRPGRPGGDFGNSQPGQGGRKPGRHRGGKHRRPR